MEVMELEVAVDQHEYKLNCARLRAYDAEF